MHATGRQTPGHDISEFTDIVLIGTAEQVAALSHIAKAAGALVYRSAPRPMGGTDPRLRVHLRLNLRT